MAKVAKEATKAVLALVLQKLACVLSGSNACSLAPKLIHPDIKYI